MSAHLRKIRRQRLERLVREARDEQARRWCNADCPHERVAPDRASHRMAKNRVGPGYHQEWRAKCLVCGMEGWFQEAGAGDGYLYLPVENDPWVHERIS